MQTQESQLNIISQKESQKNRLSKSKSFIYEQIKPNLRYGNWITTDKWSQRGSSWYILCKCDCGLQRNVLGYDLVRNKSKKCRSCATVERNLKHGQNCHGKITYEYQVWQQLKLKKDLCPEWEKSFELFFKDIGKRPEKGYTLNKKNYKTLHSISNSFWGHRRLKYFHDLEGKKIHKWTVLQKDLISNRVRWLCQCDCGNKDYVIQSSLIHGKSKNCKSCGMKGKGPLKLKHGKSKSPIYKIYHGIKDRCYNKNKKCYHHYGGRGIKMCPRWLESFDNFYEDMGERPSHFHSIDRIDVNGDYSKENCKWSTQKEQCIYRRKINNLQNENKILKEKIKLYEEKFGEI